MNREKPTLRMHQRLISFDGGSTFTTAFAAATGDIERHWADLLESMEAEARAKAEAVITVKNRKAFLAAYLAVASSHLVVGGASVLSRKTNAR